MVELGWGLLSKLQQRCIDPNTQDTRTGSTQLHGTYAFLNTQCCQWSGRDTLSDFVVLKSWKYGLVGVTPTLCNSWGLDWTSRHYKSRLLGFEVTGEMNKHLLKWNCSHKTPNRDFAPVAKWVELMTSLICERHFRESGVTSPPFLRTLRNPELQVEIAWCHLRASPRTPTSFLSHVYMSSAATLLANILHKICIKSLKC